MIRREFITLLGGAAAWPLAARAQQPGKLPIVGFLGVATPATWSQWTASFVERLRDLGWVDGRNVSIEYRWAEGRSDRFAEFLAQFVRRKVDVIFTAGSAVFAAKQLTSSIPVVFAMAPDPIGDGLVDSLARPGGNVTGLSNQQAEVAGKRVELLREVVPGLSRLAIMVNINNPGAGREASAAEAAARSLGLEIVTLQIRRAEDIVPALDAIKGRAQALYVCSDFLFFTYRIRLNTMALALRLPTIFGERENVEAAGLMSYGPNFPDLFRRAAELVNKILRGTKPADIPVEQPTKFDLVINLTTAKALGLQIPDRLLALADQVIE